MLTGQPASQRQTKYCRDIVSLLQKVGHATNAELLQQLRTQYPRLSATTVHRATMRLSARGKIGIAPPALDGSVRYDANIVPHDHFMCNSCGRVQDAHIKDAVVPLIERSIAGCRISGQITVSGICKTCVTGGRI